MSRRTVSNLSRETKVSRPTIYKHIEQLQIDRPKSGKEFSVEDYQRLQDSVLKKPPKRKKEIPKINEEVQVIYDDPLISDKGTTYKRLAIAKKDFEFNQKVIEHLKQEIDDIKAENGNYAAVNGNGATSTIPQLNKLEQYVKLNIQLSRLISNLESDLDLENEGDNDDPSDY